MIQKLAIIGASYLQLPLVLKAKEMALETYCFAWNEGAVCKDFVDYYYPISVIEKEQILEVCISANIDGVISIASDVSVPTVNYIAEKMGIIGNRSKDSSGFTNKFIMRELFKMNKVSSPKYFKITKESQLKNLVNLTFPLIVKPVDRSGSRGVQKVNSKSELETAIKRAQKESFINECIVEQYIEGVEVSVESISWNGKHYILAITDKETTSDPYFVELAHHQPSILDIDTQNKIKIETKKALAAINFKYGASHSEFRITEAKDVYAIEVGARMGGDFIGSDLVYLSTGYDFLKGTIQVALGQFITPIIRQYKYSGIYFLCSEREYIAQIIKNHLLPQIVKAEILNDEIVKIQDSSQRSGYFIYQSTEKLLV